MDSDMSGSGKRGEKGGQSRQEMYREHHESKLWAYTTVLLLGVWCITSPVTLGYQAPEMIWSDVISGTLLMLFGALSLSPRRIWGPWAACLVGTWLLFAPLVFWAPDPAAYLNDNIVGMLVIALTILIPGMPGMMLMMEPGPEIPPGWSYDPSSWMQRIPIIVLGWIGFFASRYLAAHQLGYFDHAWDPFFPEGTMRVLHSNVSRSWPVSDAGLGTLSYTLEVLMGYMGGPARWRTMPWMVTFFGILVVPLGTVSIVLVILQPIAVGAWCTLCLITAGAMLLMIPLAVDEVVAMMQFLRRARREGRPFWRTFWKGGTVEGGRQDDRTPRLTAPLRLSIPAMFWGVSASWNLVVTTLLGVWMMLAPAVFGSSGALADSDHLFGSLVVTVSVIAFAEVTRLGRYLNVLLAAWIVASPWILGVGASPAGFNDLLCGIAVIVFSIRCGPVRESYNIYNRFVT